MQPTRANQTLLREEQMALLDRLLEQEIMAQRRTATVNGTGYGPDDFLTQNRAAAQEAPQPDGIYAREPTARESIADALTPVFQSLRGLFPDTPTDARSAYRDAENLSGLLDFMPLVGGGISAEQARRDLGQGDYGSAALNGAFALMDVVPSVAAVRKGIKPATKGLREGMVDLPDNPIARDYFVRQMTDAKASHGPIGKSVDVYTPDEYAGMRLAMRPEGDAGYAVKPDGEIASVVKNKNADFRGFGEAVMRRSEPQGGYWLNAFDTALPSIYGRGGFQPVSRLPFNEDVARGDWGDEATEAFMAANAKYSGGRPDLVFMARDPSVAAPVVQGQGGLLTDDWDLAVQALDDKLKQLGYRK